MAKTPNKQGVWAAARELRSQGFRGGACAVKSHGNDSPACQVTLRERGGKLEQLIGSVQLSRPENYLSIYQSGCNFSCRKCHSWYFSRIAAGQWHAVDSLLAICRRYEEKVTLIELPLVITIVIVLTVLLVPLVRRAWESSRRTQCIGHLMQLGRAFAQYLNEYGSYAPPAEKGLVQFKWGKGDGWMDKLFPYLVAEADGRGPSYPESAGSERTAIFRCAKMTTCAADGKKYLSSYIMNCRLWLDSPGGKWDMLKLRHPQKVVVLYDRNRWTGNPDNADMTDEWGNKATDFSDKWGPGGLWYYPSGGPDFSGPHDGGYDILFADLHVRWFRYSIRAKMTRHAEQ